MNIYIFNDVENLTDNYHSGGGLVVMAKDEMELREVIKRGCPTAKIWEKEWAEKVVLPLERSEESRPRMWVFPNAGCC